MDNSRIKRFIPLITALLLVSLLASGFSCSRSSGQGLGGDWNPGALSPVEVSRLSFTVPMSVYYLHSAVIESQSDLDDYVLDIENRHDRDNRADFLANVDEWQIDFSTHSIVLYRHIESSGSTQVEVGEPQIEGSYATIPVNIGVQGITDDLGCYCYAYRVSKAIDSVTFVVEGSNNVYFNLSDGVISMQVIIEN